MSTLSYGNMGLHQYVVVRVTPDQKNYAAFVVDPTCNPSLDANGLPNEPLGATRSKSAATICAAIQGSLPTLGT